MPAQDLVSPPRRVGLVDGSGTFRRSAVLVFDPLGFAWRTRADGAQAWVRPTDDDPRTLDVVPVDRAPEVWRRIPPDRQAEAWSWDADGRGLWLVERGPDGLHVLSLPGPDEAAEVAQVAASPAAWIAAIGPADTAMLFTSPAGEGPPVALVRADLATGAVTSLVDDLGTDAIHAIANITGGGISGNLPRVLPADCDVQIRLGSWEVLPIFRYIFEKGGVEVDEMLRVFNMGIGMVLIVAPEAVEPVTRRLQTYGQKHFFIGNVVAGSGKVVYDHPPAGFASWIR